MIKCAHCKKTQEVESLNELKVLGWKIYEDSKTNELEFICSDSCEDEYFDKDEENSFKED
ncbi:hypothetical protein D3C71_2174330 [compost metagenome]